MVVRIEPENIDVAKNKHFCHLHPTKVRRKLFQFLTKLRHGFFVAALAVVGNQHYWVLLPRESDL